MSELMVRGQMYQKSKNKRGKEEEEISPAEDSPVNAHIKRQNLITAR